jgi:(1->4)-alpha-D-glucan 1-alpha-D-glucosylmutase
LYQTLIGAWPFEPISDAQNADFVERIQQYMSKALGEAKVHASWVNPDPDYDAGVRRFVAAILDRSGRNRFLRDFLPFQPEAAA